jgi:hypothetical protein
MLQKTTISQLGHGLSATSAAHVDVCETQQLWNVSESVSVRSVLATDLGDASVENDQTKW